MSKRHIPPLPSHFKTPNPNPHPSAQPNISRRKSVCSNKQFIRQDLEHLTIRDSSTVQRDMFQILQEENNNLRNQNQFLMSQVRILTDKERHHQEMEKKFKEVIGELKTKNHDLEDRVEELNELLSSEMEMFDQRMKEMVLYQEVLEKKDLQNSWREEAERGKTMSLSAFINSDEIKEKESSETMSSRRLFEEFGHEFNRLLEEGKEEKQHEKRKEIRRRMTQLASKMEELRKFNEL